MPAKTIWAVEGGNDHGHTRVVTDTGVHPVYCGADLGFRDLFHTLVVTARNGAVAALTALGDNVDVMPVGIPCPQGRCRTVEHDARRGNVTGHVHNAGIHGHHEPGSLHNREHLFERRLGPKIDHAVQREMIRRSKLHNGIP